MECNAADIGLSLIDLIFPPRCTACAKILEERRALPICEACFAGLRFSTSPLCPSCGAPYADQTATDHPCEACLLSPPPFAAMRSVAVYAGVLQDMIHRCKYGHDISLGEFLGDMMADFPYPSFDLNDFTMVMPVPLHIKRLRERGFNQSLLLARAIAGRHKMKLDYLSLTRTTPTPPQTNFGRQEREENVKGAFAVARPLRLRGEKVILVDDVYTTGSTVRECARVLKRSGVASVAVLTL
ncbi:MAG: ComF family protein, partial [Syntrophales bacterium]|nr:ComF family protein [Syntrophales bacterium]